MSGNYQKPYKKVNFKTTEHKDLTFDTLNKNTKEYYMQILDLIGSEYFVPSSQEHINLIKNTYSCITCLGSFLYQASKMKEHNEYIRMQLPSSCSKTKDSLLVINGIEASTDFESLLYQARATLDKITFFISGQIYHSETDKFNKLPNILKNFIQKDTKAIKAITIIEDSIDFFEGLIINTKDNRTSLRSLLAHSKSHSETLNGCFTIHHSIDVVLRFDQELNNYPILNSSYLLTKYITYVVLNLLSIFLNIDEQLDIDNCSASWYPCCIDPNKFKIDDIPHNNLIFDSLNRDKYVPFSIAKMQMGGFKTDTYKFSLDILDFMENEPLL